MARVICAGTIVVDFVMRLDGPPVMGRKIRVRGSDLRTGGGGMNAAVAVARLGGTADLAGTIGDDLLGRFLREECTRHGIGDRLVRTTRAADTSHSSVLITPDGERTVLNHRQEALYDQAPALDDFPWDAALADSRWPMGAVALMRAARAAGRPGVIDAEAPIAPAAEAIAAASHVAFSEQGLEDFAGRADARGLEEAAARLGVWVAVTRGADPVLCHDGRRMAEVAAFPVTATDTLGAGDVWHAAFALALAEGRGEAPAVRWANAAAALKVSERFGGEGLRGAVDALADGAGQ